MARHLILPASGLVQISTDVHGNAEDFAALEDHFLSLRDSGVDAHWVILGDIVHAPDAQARDEQPDLYDFPDGSMAIADRILALQIAHPGRVHFVLGNHDHAHVGGPRVGKFYADEAAELESTLTSAQIQRLHGLFQRALFAVAAPCGALLTHGVPDATLLDLRLLEDIPLRVEDMSSAQRAVMRPLLTSYGQQNATAATLLSQLSAAHGLRLGVVIHGHDRDVDGFFREGEHQLCPCLFGAPRPNKRFVLLDLAAYYPNVHALRDGHEIRRLFPGAPQ